MALTHRPGNKSDLFRFVPPSQYLLLSPFTEHVPLHRKSLRENMARVSGGANNMHPLSCGAQTENIRQIIYHLVSNNGKLFYG